MAFDEGLAERVRVALAEHQDLGERKMFGGLCFLLSGNMCCGIMGDELMLRVGKDAYDEVMAQPHSRQMDFTGRVSKGMVYVEAAGIAEDDALALWLEPAIAFAQSLPPK